MGGQRHPPTALRPRKTRYPFVQEAGWAPGPVWTDAEILASAVIRSPDRPARTESLDRLSYRGPYCRSACIQKGVCSVIIWNSVMYERYFCRWSVKNYSPVRTQFVVLLPTTCFGLKGHRVVEYKNTHARAHFVCGMEMSKRQRLPIQWTTHTHSGSQYAAIKPTLSVSTDTIESFL